MKIVHLLAARQPAHSRPPPFQIFCFSFHEFAMKVVSEYLEIKKKIEFENKPVIPQEITDPFRMEWAENNCSAVRIDHSWKQIVEFPKLFD